MSCVGQLEGYLEGLDCDKQLETVIQNMVAEAMKLSEIEGEYLELKDVKSSVRNNFGLNVPKEVVSVQRETGMAALLTDVREIFSEPLTYSTRFAWHSSFPTGCGRSASYDSALEVKELY